MGRANSNVQPSDHLNSGGVCLHAYAYSGTVRCPTTGRAREEFSPAIARLDGWLQLRPCHWPAGLATRIVSDVCQADCSSPHAANCHTGWGFWLLARCGIADPTDIASYYVYLLEATTLRG